MGRTERLFRLASLLRDQKPLRFDELLERTGVSPATLKRDLKYLREQLNTPVVYDAFDRTYQVVRPGRGPLRELPGVWFSEAELLALLMAHRLLSELDPRGLLAARLLRVVERLEGLLLGDASPSDLLQRIKVIMPGRREVDGECFAAVTEATVQRRRLRLRYFTRSRGCEAERDVSPQRLVFHRTWYLDAWCHSAQALRRFALDGMRGVRKLDEPAREMLMAELEHRLDGSYGSFAGEARRWAVLLFSKEVARWVAHEQWHPLQRARLQADGCLELMLPYDNPTELVMDILRHGAAVEVLGDDELRTAVAAQARSLARLYG